jgi:hypothetical protein
VQYLKYDAFYKKPALPYANFQDPVQAERAAKAKATRATAAESSLMGETAPGSDDERVAQAETKRRNAGMSLANAQQLLQGVKKGAAAAPAVQTPAQRQMEEEYNRITDAKMALTAEKRAAAALVAKKKRAAAAAAAAPGAPGKKGHSAPALGGRGGGGGGEGKEDRPSEGGKGPGGIKALRAESKNSKSKKSATVVRGGSSSLTPEFGNVSLGGNGGPATAGGDGGGAPQARNKRPTPSPATADQPKRARKTKTPEEMALEVVQLRKKAPVAGAYTSATDDAVYKSSVARYGDDSDDSDDDDDVKDARRVYNRFHPRCPLGHVMPEHAHKTLIQKRQKFTGYSICCSDKVPPTEIAYHCKRKECHGLQACIGCIKGTPGAEGVRWYQHRPSQILLQYQGVEGELAAAVVLRNEFDLRALSLMATPMEFHDRIDRLSESYPGVRDSDSHRAMQEGAP